MSSKKINYMLIGIIILLIAYLLFDNYYIDKRAAETKQIPTVSEKVVKAGKTIAVLPFISLSSDPEQQYFADGFSEEVINNLAQIPDLGVAEKTSSFSFKGSNKTLQEIANIIGVKYLLEGALRKADNSFRVTATLIQAADGIHLWSKTYDRELKDISAVQEDIATSIADELKAALGNRGWIGIFIQSVPPMLKEKLKLKNENGALVVKVTPGGPADKAGLKEYDVIITFDEKEIREVNALPPIVASTELGKTVSVELIRDGEEKTLKVKIEELKE